MLISANVVEAKVLEDQPGHADHLHLLPSAHLGRTGDPWASARPSMPPGGGSSGGTSEASTCISAGTSAILSLSWQELAGAAVEGRME